jgi:carboxymethylenebutenolidase
VSQPAEPKPSPEGVPGAVLDTSAIRAETLTYPGAEGTAINGYLARPADAGSHPGMVVIHEAGGLGEHIRDVVDRFANIGYVTLAVDLYTREGGPPPPGDMAVILQRLFALPDARVLGDLEGAADLLRAREDVSGKVGCIGFCVGGRMALLFACASDRLDAVVDCWGGFIDKATLEETTTANRPTPPLQMAGKLGCPLYAAVGAEDHNPSPEIGAELLERASASGQQVTLEVYEGAGHAFFADYRPTYRPGPAHRLWREIVPFLAQHLRGG